MNTNFNFKKTKTFDNDLICNDINESFNKISNKKKKLNHKLFLFLKDKMNLLIIIYILIILLINKKKMKIKIQIYLIIIIIQEYLSLP